MDLPGVGLLTSPLTLRRSVDPLLTKGWSYEDISRKTNIPLSEIRTYGDASRPGYGVKDAHTSSGETSTGGSGGGGYSQPAYNPADLSWLDSQIGRTQGQYGKADTALSQGLKQLLGSYNKSRDDANYQRGREIENIDLKREDTGREDILNIFRG